MLSPDDLEKNCGTAGGVTCHTVVSVDGSEKQGKPRWIADLSQDFWPNTSELVYTERGN
jgi:hypothetical protein